MTPGQGQIFRLGVQPAGIARAAFAASSGLRCAAMLCLLRQLCSGAGHDVGLEPLDAVANGRQRSGMAAFPVPRYLAETARRDRGVHDWIVGLPAIVAGLASQWSKPGQDLVVTRLLDRLWSAPHIGSPLMRQVAKRLAPA